MSIYWRRLMWECECVCLCVSVTKRAAPSGPCWSWPFFPRTSSLFSPAFSPFPDVEDGGGKSAAFFHLASLSPPFTQHTNGGGNIPEENSRLAFTVLTWRQEAALEPPCFVPVQTLRSETALLVSRKLPRSCQQKPRYAVSQRHKDSISGHPLTYHHNLAQICLTTYRLCFQCASYKI